MARDYFYYEAPFFKTDDIAYKTGKILVENMRTQEEVYYEGYPKTITFDGNKKCTEGDVLTLNIIKY